MASRDPDRRLLPHEIAFSALFAAVIARLIAAPGGPAWVEIAVWGGLAALSGLAASLTRRRSNTLRWRVRLGAYVIIMNAAYFRMGPVARALRSASGDALLQRMDTALFGKPLPLYLDGLTTPAVSEILSACYFLLFPYILFSCGRQLVRFPAAPDEARRFYSGFFLVYAIGFFGYLLIPAQGPYLDIPTAFAHPIAGGWMTRLNDDVVRQGTNRVDVFPSLHVASSAFMLLFDRRFARWRFWAYLVPAVGLWVSTLYLHYHYGVDILSGFALAGIGLWIAFRSSRSALTSPLAPNDRDAS